MKKYKFKEDSNEDYISTFIDDAIKNIDDIFHISCDCIPKYRVGQLGEFNVYIVDGDRVKIKYEPDFVEAGNPFRYSEFIPKDEIWLDMNLDKDDWPPNLLHEFVESMLMKNKGLDYDTAHEYSNKIEKEYRKRLYE